MLGKLQIAARSVIQAVDQLNRLLLRLSLTQLLRSGSHWLLCFAVCRVGILLNLELYHLTGSRVHFGIRTARHS
ncbi:hypothetical protein D3C80_1497480 [compost metagenome]